MLLPSTCLLSKLGSRHGYLLMVKIKGHVLYIAIERTNLSAISLSIK